MQVCNQDIADCVFQTGTLSINFLCISVIESLHLKWFNMNYQFQKLYLCWFEFILYKFLLLHNQMQILNHYIENCVCQMGTHKKRKIVNVTMEIMLLRVQIWNLKCHFRYFVHSCLVLCPTCLVSSALSSFPIAVSK